MADIDLGFPEENEPEWLTNRYFPSKLGGKPAWLELQKLPTTTDLECNNCKSQKSFLCQIYAPGEEEHNFHRCLYVFLCRTPECQQPNSANNFTVLRSQLPRKNDFYSENPPEEDGEPLAAIHSKQKLCVVCGCLAPLSCARCKHADYCCKAHQKAHWQQHKNQCSTEKQADQIENIAITSIIFPEYEIVIEPNDAEENQNNSTSDSASEESERLATYEKLAAEGKAGTMSDISSTELEKYGPSTEDEDKFFNKFQNEVSKNAEQILRYKRNGKPLWISDVAKTIATQLENIPKCNNCGEKRQFEFQIMPQMLLLLKDESLDWGVLAIYACARSCTPTDDKGYLQEYIIKQDIVANT